MRRVRIEPGMHVAVVPVAPPVPRAPRPTSASGLPPSVVEPLSAIVADVLESVFASSLSLGHAQELARTALRHAGGALDSTIFAHPSDAHRLAHWEECGAMLEADPSIVPGGVVVRAAHVEIDARAQIQLLRAVQRLLEERSR